MSPEGAAKGSAPARGGGTLLARRVPVTVVLALRYLRSTRRDAFVSFLSLVAAGGIALGVAALILALGALSGFQEALRGEILARTPEIEVRLPPDADPEAARDAALAVPGVVAAQRIARGRGWLVSGDRVRRVALVAWGEEVPRSFPWARTAGPADGVLLPDRLQAAWGLAPGDIVEIASSRPTLTPLGPRPRVRRLPVAGSYAAGRTEEEERLALPLSAARGLLGGEARLLEVEAGGLDAALALVEELEAALPAGSEVRSWRELQRPLFFALRLEKTVMFVAVGLIVLVAALALVADLSLIISSKRAEIGMLGAMGATPGELRLAFLLLGGSLAALGSASGAAVGLAGAWALDRFRLLALPEQVYFLDHVPFAVRAGDLAAVVAVTAGLALTCAWLAAGRAAALRPVEALRR